MQKRNFLLKVRKSRKSYFLIYLMIFIIVGFLIYFNRSGLTVPDFTLMIDCPIIAQPPIPPNKPFMIFA